MLLYSLDNVKINDSWYCRDDSGVYHSFFLEYGMDEPIEYCWDRQRIGHTVSRDLLKWDYLGHALTPDANSWDDLGLATGSVVKHGGEWYMVYTGKGEKISGLGVARSSDLSHWTRCGDGPVILCRGGIYYTELGGEPVEIRPLADPYVYPEAIDGKYYIFVNSHIKGFPYNKRGTQAVFTTSDFERFELSGVALLSDFDRMETAHVWKHGDKFYMYSGCVTANPETGKQQGRAKNCVFISDSIDGPYTYLQELSMPTECSFPYIAKVLESPSGDEVLLVNDYPIGARGPYSIRYEADGRMVIVGS